MFNYCMEQQAEGYDDALAFQKKYGELPDLDQISNYAARKWLKAREYQYDMVAYEMENQIDAFLNISYDLKSGRYAERDVRSCIAKWYTEDEPQWDMVEYCLEN